MTSSPATMITIDALEERLSRPAPAAVQAMTSVEQRMLVLGAGGKMGPSLTRMARRALDDAGRSDVPVTAVSRFGDRAVRDGLESHGVETIACDLLDAAARQKLPPADHVLLMAGHKFGGDDPSRYWAVNVFLPASIAEQYPDARMVCFSTGNVYPFVPIDTPPPTESTPCDPVGEYAASCLGRERVIEFASRHRGMPACLLRLNYAVDLRYGVLVDLAQQLLAGQAIDLSVPMVNFVWQGYANAVALAAFSLAATPADVLNVTGQGTWSVRELARELADRLGVDAKFAGAEGTTALVSDAARCHGLFGPPEPDGLELVDCVAAWLKSGGTTLGRPTKFQVRDGRY